MSLNCGCAILIIFQRPEIFALGFCFSLAVPNVRFAIIFSPSISSKSIHPRHTDCKVNSIHCYLFPIRSFFIKNLHACHDQKNFVVDALLFVYGMPFGLYETSVDALYQQNGQNDVVNVCPFCYACWSSMHPT